MDGDLQQLRCKGLFRSFDGVRAVAGVDVVLPAAGVVALIGPNGAGKTTLFDILTGVTRPDRGHVWLGDREITRLAPHKIARLGIARSFQDLRLIMEMSVLRNVMLSRPRQRGETLIGALLGLGVASEEARNRDESLRLLRQVGLDGNRDTDAGDLSYGQQKLLTLVCCVATEVRVLLLDEPVAGVHPEMVRQILQLLRDLRQDNRLVVFIEHDLTAVREIADRVIVMDDGAIIADGSPAEVLSRPDILEAYVA